MASIVIIGAGTGGAAAARALRGRLGRKHRVTLVEQKPDLCCQPSLLWLMIGRRRLRDISRRTDRMRAGGAEVICSKALALDTVQKTVRLESGRTLSYDVLILAPGADVSQADTKELAKAGFNLYTPEGALAIRKAIEHFRGGEVVFLVASLPYKCPPAVYEASFLLHEWFAKKGLRWAVNISVHIPESSPLPPAGPRVGRAFEKKLKKKSINLFTNQRFLQVDRDNRTIHFASGSIPYDMLIYVPRHQAPDLVTDTDLPDGSGWVPVDPYTLETKVEGVYAIGDVSHISLPSGFEMPKSGATAHFQAFVVADNIEKLIKGQKPSRFFGGKSMCMVEVGTTGFPFFGDLYQPKPNLLVLPESRIWLAGKTAAERMWLREHS